ncbi:MAG: ribonuclease H-like domain-containing protein [Myxococcales bacterium]|nr:ribonuclease H-like domain-containing protein [Myxococcales bacterium]
MDLRTKLSRLRPSAGTPPRTPEPAVEPPLDDRLAALRARMSDLVARSRSKVAEAREKQAAEIEARLAASPLPFEEEATALGPVHVRQVPHPVQSRVGWADVHAARGAQGDDLALLAIDPGLAGCDPSRALYLDTEATGLAGGTGTIPFLIGVAWFEGSSFVVEQLLLRRLGEEAPMLARLAERIAASSMLVTFNGKSFDMPLLRTRYVMNRLPLPQEPPHFDLVHLARRIHRRAPPRAAERAVAGAGAPSMERWDDEGAQRVASCKLVALERTLLGFAREGDIDGGEVPARYTQFLRHGDADAIRAVCDHNLWDVVSMAGLVGVYAEGLRSVASDDAPASRLTSHDLVGLARTLDRAGALALARRAADVAVADAERDGADALLTLRARTVRGGLHKKARDVEAARDDFAHLAQHHDDPHARLELAKLLEHRLRAPEEALRVVEQGTTEDPARFDHRRERLRRKVAGRRGHEQLPLPRALDARRSKD